jgi:hypothetical protein
MSSDKANRGTSIARMLAGVPEDPAPSSAPGTIAGFRGAPPGVRAPDRIAHLSRFASKARGVGLVRPRRGDRDRRQEKKPSRVYGSSRGVRRAGQRPRRSGIESRNDTPTTRNPDSPTQSVGAAVKPSKTNPSSSFQAACRTIAGRTLPLSIQPRSTALPPASAPAKALRTAWPTAALPPLSRPPGAAPSRLDRSPRRALAGCCRG